MKTKATVNNVKAVFALAVLFSSLHRWASYSPAVYSYFFPRLFLKRLTESLFLCHWNFWVLLPFSTCRECVSPASVDLVEVECERSSPGMSYLTRVDVECEGLLGEPPLTSAFSLVMGIGGETLVEAGEVLEGRTSTHG